MVSRSLIRLAIAATALLCCSCTQAVQDDDATAAIAAALDSVWVAAIGENHGHAEFHEWLLDALADTALQRRVDDVAVEFGNSLYQDIADRFVAGEDLPDDSVRLIWRNTIVSPNVVWDSPVYERLIFGIRRINAERSDGRAYRLLLLDTPVDWNVVVEREDLAPFLNRSAHMAEIVEREVFRSGRRAILVAGAAHLTRVNMLRDNRAGVPTAEVSVVTRLSLHHPGTLFVVRSTARTGELEGDWLPSVSPGRLVRTDQRRLSRISANAVSTMRNLDGSPFTLYGDATLVDLADAIIYWGPAESNHFLDASTGVFADEDYWRELNRRSILVRGEPMDPRLRDGMR